MESNSTEDKFEAAEYRVRLFLSADLSGSTAYKNSDLGQRTGEEGVPEWVSTFSSFYQDFPATFQNIFNLKKTEEAGDCKCPHLWKAVGDELVFCTRVRSKKEIQLCVASFIDALHDYRGQTLRNKERTSLPDDDNERGNNIDLKGAGWLATFPHPNLAIKIVDDGDMLKFSEEIERAADDNPFAFDFVGKAIDTGFRVAQTAERARFALSVQLAQTLLDLRDGFQIHADRPQQLRGVNRGAPYPTLYIDTMDHFLFCDVRIEERKLFGFDKKPDEIKEYLKKYCEAVGTEVIKLPVRSGDKKPDPPEDYTKFVEAQKEHLRRQKDLQPDTEPKEAGTEVAADSEGLPEATFKPLQK